MEFENLQIFQAWLLDSKFPHKGIAGVIVDRLWERAHSFYVLGKRPRDWDSYYRNVLKADVDYLVKITDKL